MISKKSPKITVIVNGKKMSFKAYKKENRLAELKKKRECLSLKEAAKILDMPTRALLKQINEKGIVMEKIGNETMIRRLDLLAMR